MKVFIGIAGVITAAMGVVLVFVTPVGILFIAAGLVELLYAIVYRDSGKGQENSPMKTRRALSVILLLVLIALTGTSGYVLYQDTWKEPYSITNKVNAMFAGRTAEDTAEEEMDEDMDAEEDAAVFPDEDPAIGEDAEFFEEQMPGPAGDFTEDQMGFPDEGLVGKQMAGEDV